PLWPANFLLKPTHAMGWALVGLVLGQRARGSGGWRMGVLLGVLSWAFLLDWAYLAAALALSVLPRGERKHLRAIVAALLVSACFVAPYVVHLAIDYNPLDARENARQVWR